MHVPPWMAMSVVGEGAYTLVFVGALLALGSPPGLGLYPMYYLYLGFAFECVGIPMVILYRRAARGS